VLQGFCLFHAYKNGTQQKWFYIIIFLPIIGSLIYLYEIFFHARSISNFSENVKGMVFSNYEVSKLEKEVKYSETTTNKIKLAEAYIERNRYDEAIKLLESCQQNGLVDSPDFQKLLLKAFFFNKEYNKVIEVGDKINSVKAYGDNGYKVAYAWSLWYCGNNERAEEEFKSLNTRFSNFVGRVEYAKFLIENKRKDEAKNLLNNLVNEYEGMDKNEKKWKRDVMVSAKNLLSTIK